MAYKLLLADDSVTIQRVIELTFADEDVQVVAVGDGDQAIARLESNPPDIVLADAGMPGPSGYDVAEFIKTTPALAHIPVLLLTGAFEPIDEARARAVGCDGVLAKPFEPQLVIERVRELLNRPAVRHGADAEPVIPADQVPPSAVPAADEIWAPAVSLPDAPVAQAPGPEKTVDAYFDRLDAAFASLGDREMAPPLAPAFEPPPFEPPPLEPPAAAPVWPRSDASSLPLAPTPTPAAATPLPSLPEAFSAILAAEREASPGEPPAWPVPSQTAVVDDALVEEIAQRVIDRLSDRVVRETVADTVSRIAERLAREEIERIRAKVK